MEENERNYDDVNDSNVEEKVVRSIDEITDIEIIPANDNYDPSQINNGASINFSKPVTRVRKPSFNKYQSFSQMNKNGGFVRMAGIGGIIVVATFILLYFMFKQ